jgi:hypothetical protein
MARARLLDQVGLFEVFRLAIRVAPHRPGHLGGGAAQLDAGGVLPLAGRGLRRRRVVGLGGSRSAM